MARAI